MPPERRKRACRECRRQKIRCDIDKIKGSLRCSRCQRMDLSCDTRASVDRTSRKTKAELERDLENLKHQTQQLGEHTTTPASSNGVVKIPSPISSMRPSLISAADISNSACPTRSRASSRIFESQSVDAQKIDDCFQIFFEDYAPIFPALDPGLSPDEYYELSRFLFWVVVFIGARRHRTDPTLLDRLSPHINSLALRSLQSRSHKIHTIQGLLLLCLWPAPTSSISKSLSHTFAGIALSLALEEGLHVSGVGQDFARTRVISTTAQKVSRAQLWSYCVVVCQCTSISEGLVPLVTADSSDSGIGEDFTVTATLPPLLNFRRKIHAIFFNAMLTLLRTNQGSRSTNLNELLSSLITLFDSQLVSLDTQTGSPIDKVHLYCARVQLQAFRFLGTSSNPDLPGLITLFATSRELIESASTMHASSGSLAFLTQFVERSITLAAYSILKCLRSHQLSSYIDLEAGERAYFTAILLIKQNSLQNDDLSARGAAIMTQLWNSSRIFHRSGGRVDSIRTRIKSRLSMSVVFDCFWWWREEFGGQASPYEDPELNEAAPTVAGSGIPAAASLLSPNGGTSTEGATPTDIFDPFLDGVFPDFDWAANFDLPAMLDYAR